MTNSSNDNETSSERCLDTQIPVTRDSGIPANRHGLDPIAEPFLTTEPHAENYAPKLNYSRIERISTARPHGQGSLERLKRSQLGRLYIGKLKHVPAIRKGTIWLWKTFYPAYICHIAPFLFRRKSPLWKPLKSISKHAVDESAGSKFALAPPSHVETPTPIAFPEDSRSVLVSPHKSYDFPEVFVTTVDNVTVHGGTNLVLAEKEIIHHNLYDFERDYTSEELHGRSAIDPKRRRARWLLHDSDPGYIDTAGLFVDACAPNYAHWLTEVLPRIAVFCNDERFSDIPLIVNDDLHRNLMESVLLLTCGERRIIALPIGRALIIKRLYLTSSAGYVPFERRTKQLSGHSHGLFSPAALNVMRRTFSETARNFPPQKWPEKFFLRRNSGVRCVINSAEIEEKLVDLGYAVIEPEKLSFLQQVQLFSGAKAVVGSTGAALANIIFCPPGTRITIFIAEHPDTSYWYWQNIAAASKNVVRYVLGKCMPESGRGIHSDFHVTVDDVVKAL